ncbi:fimbrial protein [Kosakonia sp. BYX6]|uniref:Fimbrial protein n=1 Tax=Kosakonia calanthes TaxID=3139408 RepID=A0ABZ3B5U1_9ENTR
MTFIRIILLNLFLFISLPVSALCSKGPDFVRTELDAWGVGLGLGTVNVSSLAIHPVGTPLGANIVTFANNPRYRGPESILWVCDIADKNNIFEIISTNGDDRNGGFFDLGAADGYPNYYSTLFSHVGLRLTHVNSGTVFTRQYQRIPMKNYGLSADGTKIFIRVKDFSPIRADLIRISSVSLFGKAPSDYCGKKYQITTGAYTCDQPNGYVSFCSPNSPATYCDSGDSAYDFNGWWKDNWMAINMGNATIPGANLVSRPTCVAKSVTPIVMFPTISITDLNNGQSAQSHFDVRVLCEGLSNSGTVQGMTALGLQVPYDSYLAAKQLNLVNASGGVSHLLPANYGQPGVAGGVGIRIANANSGVLRNFLGWYHCQSGTCLTGNNGGWYAVRDGATMVSSGGAHGISEYAVNFNAYLTRIAGQTVTAGKVDASAQVLVKVQ